MKTTLSLELDDKDQLRFLFKGDPVLITKMIRTAMDARPDVVTVFLTAALSYMKDNNIPLSDMVRVSQMGVNKKAGH